MVFSLGAICISSEIHILCNQLYNFSASVLSTTSFHIKFVLLIIAYIHSLISVSLVTIITERYHGQDVACGLSCGVSMGCYGHVHLCPFAGIIYSYTIEANEILAASPDYRPRTAAHAEAMTTVLRSVTR